MFLDVYHVKYLHGGSSDFKASAVHVKSFHIKLFMKHVFDFILFIDSRSLLGYSVSRMTILVFWWQITIADIRQQVKWAVNHYLNLCYYLVILCLIANDHHKLPQGLYWYIWVNMLTFSHPKIHTQRSILLENKLLFVWTKTDRQQDLDSDYVFWWLFWHISGKSKK